MTNSITAVSEFHNTVPFQQIMSSKHYIPSIKAKPERRKYKVRGEDITFNIAGDTPAQIRWTAYQLLERLEEIKGLKLYGLPHLIEWETGMPNLKPVDEYRFCSPVKNITLEIAEFKDGERIIIQMFEHRGERQSFMFKSNEQQVTAVINTLRGIVQRLAGK